MTTQTPTPTTQATQVLNAPPLQSAVNLDPTYAFMPAVELWVYVEEGDAAPMQEKPEGFATYSTAQKLLSVIQLTIADAKLAQDKQAGPIRGPIQYVIEFPDESELIVGDLAAKVLTAAGFVAQGGEADGSNLIYVSAPSPVVAIPPPTGTTGPYAGADANDPTSLGPFGAVSGA
jgi:hypothetical protein